MVCVTISGSQRAAPLTGGAHLSKEQLAEIVVTVQVPGLVDLIKDVDQGTVVVGPESNMEFDRGVIGRGTQVEPVVQDGISLVF